jgi:hypothetical protein
MNVPQRVSCLLKPRISLRSLLLMMAVLCVLFAWFGACWYSAKRQERAVAALKPVGGAAGFDYRLKNHGPDSSSPKQAAWVPDGLRKLLGRHFFETIRQVGFGNPNDPNRPITDDDAMETLRSLPGVRDLDLVFTDVTDRGVERVVEYCPDLHYLYLHVNKNITDEAMKSVKKLHRLHTLQLAGTLCTDAALSQLKELTQLRELTVADSRTPSQITDEGLKHLGEMKSLTLLEVYAASVTNEGLVYLEDLPEMRELIFSKTKVTAEGAQRLQRRLPNCEITVR